MIEEIDEIADELLAELGELYENTYPGNRMDSLYLRKRRYIVLKHIKRVSQLCVDPKSCSNCGAVLQSYCKIV